MHAFSHAIHMTCFYFSPRIFNDSYLLNQMSIIETFYIFEFVLTRPSEQYLTFEKIFHSFPISNIRAHFQSFE